MKVWLALPVIFVTACDEPVPPIPVRQSLTPVGGAPRPRPLINFADITDIGGEIGIINDIDSIDIQPTCTSFLDCPTGSPEYAGVCTSGSCSSSSCSGNLKNCDEAVDGCESDVSTNTYTCGSCTNSCQPVSVATVYATCAGGICGTAACSGALRNCDRYDGCETNTATDLVNCGGCSVSNSNNCNNLVVNATGLSCSAGACNYTSCNTGFADCDDNRANGCEINKTSSKLHCGACNLPCGDPANGVASCVSSLCTFTCNGGFKKCGAGCVPTTACCLDTDCQSPPDDCKERIGHCLSGVCSYNTIQCPTVDCKNPPTCQAGTCLYSDKPVGTDCSMSGCYTQGNMGPPTCQNGDGGIYCAGVPKNCTQLDSQCARGVCDSTGTCVPQAINAGTSCTPTSCEVSPVCVAGTCRGTPKECPLPPPCHSSYCDAVTGACRDDRVLPAGEPCATSNPCLRNLRCDETGSCVGDPAQDQTPCAAPSDCTITASCWSGQCLCDDRVDASAGSDDMSANVDGGKGKGNDKGCGGCVVGGGSANGAWVFLIGALGLMARRRRRR